MSMQVRGFSLEHCVPVHAHVCAHLCVCMCETWTDKCVPTKSVSILQGLQAMAQAEQSPGQEIPKATILGAQEPSEH